MSDEEFKGLSPAWNFALGFLLGNAINTIAQDPSDYVFFWAGSQGYLKTAWGQTIFYFWVPFALWGGLFLVGYVLAVSGRVQPTFVVYLVGSVVLLGIILQLKLPQITDPTFQASLVLTSIVSAGILVGVYRHLED